MSSAQEQSEPRYYGLYHGVVVDNADPMGLSRVTVRVPGVIGGESGWALPYGFPGAGGPQRGLFDVPEIGTDVYIQFLGGDPQCPRWTGGNWGKPGGKNEVPTPLLAVAPAEAHQVKAYETARWLVTYDERAGKESLKIADKISGDNIELDGHAMGIVIKATSILSIQADGVIDIKAPVIQLGGRTVIQNGKPI